MATVATMAKSNNNTLRALGTDVVGCQTKKATRTRGCVNFTKLIVHKRGHSETVDTLTERKIPKRTNKGARGMNNKPK